MIGPVELYTDGSAIRNPGGPSGLAYIIRWFIPKENELPETKEISVSKGYRSSTNNRMEIMAVLEGLTDYYGKHKANTFGDSGQLNVFSDAEYVCNAINKRWLDNWPQRNWMTSGFGGRQPKEVANRDLWERMIQIIGQIRSIGVSITFNHVTGHNGDPLNERCDEMARSAAENNPTLIDEEYEKVRYQKR